MNKILVVGDSLTAGHPGIGFADILSKTKSHYQVVVQGRGGDTLLGISQRLPSLLKRHTPDSLIIEAGVNDLILPWFKTRGGAWKKLATRLDSLGSIPSMDITSFQSLYSETVTTAQQHTCAVIMTTIPCLGEDLNSELNQQRQEYNATIRHIAVTHAVCLADVGKAFDSILQAVYPPSTYLLNEYHNLFMDTLLTAIHATTDLLSKRRQLVLTVDGIHLNRRGAQVFAETIQNELACINSN